MGKPLVGNCRIISDLTGNHIFYVLQLYLVCKFQDTFHRQKLFFLTQARVVPSAVHRFLKQAHSVLFNQNYIRVGIRDPDENGIVPFLKLNLDIEQQIRAGNPHLDYLFLHEIAYLLFFLFRDFADHLQLFL